MKDIITGEEKDPYNELDILLLLELTRFFHRDRRTVQKKAIKLLNKSTPTAYRAVTSQISAGTAEKSAKLLRDMVDEYLYLALPAKEISKMGGDGYLVLDEDYDAIPITISYETPEDFLWARKNEDEIRTAVLKRVLWNRRETTRSVKGRILLFGSVGYSGIDKYWGVSIADDYVFDWYDFFSDSKEPTQRYKAVKE